MRNIGILRYPVLPHGSDQNLTLQYIEQFAAVGEVLFKYVTRVQDVPPKLTIPGRLYLRVEEPGAAEKLAIANRWWYMNYRFDNTRNRAPEPPNAWQPNAFGGEPEVMLLKLGGHLYTGVRPWWWKPFEKNAEGTVFAFDYEQTYVLSLSTHFPQPVQPEPEHETQG